MSKIIEVEHCYYCTNSESCELYEAQPNPPHPDCPLQSSDDWFKEELEKRFPDDDCINTYLENIGYPPYNMETINWLKFELLKGGK